MVDIEDVGPGTFKGDEEIFLCSIAISLKRIADALTVGSLGKYVERQNQDAKFVAYRASAFSVSSGDL